MVVIDKNGEIHIDGRPQPAVLYQEGCVIEFEGPADCGKTLAAVTTVFELLQCGYSGNEVHSNTWLNIPGSHYYTNAGLRLLMQRVLKDDLRHLIILADEVDSIYPSRGFKDKSQSDEVMRSYQMVKMGIYLIVTRHKGSAVDKIIRDCTDITVYTKHIKEKNVIELEILNGIDCLDDVLIKEIYPADTHYPDYDRWLTTK